MKRKTIFPQTPLVSCLLAILAGVIALEVPAKDNSNDLLEEMYIRESKQAIRENRNWSKPKNIVLVASSPFLKIDADRRAKLEAAAGNAELHVFNSIDEAAAGLQQADALMGYCNMPAMPMKNLKWVQHFRAGVDRCDANPRLKQGDVVLSNMKGVYGAGIAEHVIAMMFSLGRSLPQFQRAQAEGKWDRSIGSSSPMIELKGKTLLIVGLGGIGSEIAWRANALGMKVTATRNSSREGPSFVDYVGLASELDKLAASADVIVNATPLTKSTTDLFDQEFFNLMKPSAYFINIGRGRSVVTDDLVQALRQGQLAGAALDVTEPEPLPADHALWQMDNVIITPHTSARSDKVMLRFWTFVTENLRRFVNGEAMLNVVNLDSGY